MGALFAALGLALSLEYAVQHTRAQQARSRFVQDDEVKPADVVEGRTRRERGDHLAAARSDRQAPNGAVADERTASVGEKALERARSGRDYGRGGEPRFLRVQNVTPLVQNDSGDERAARQTEYA